MGPRSQMPMSIVATAAGLALVLSIFLSSHSANPVEVFLGVLLLVGGAVSLWSQAKGDKSKKDETAATPEISAKTEGVELPMQSEAGEFLAQYLRKSEAEDGARKTESADLPVRSEADEFLAQFLKK